MGKCNHKGRTMKIAYKGWSDRDVQWCYRCGAFRLIRILDAREGIPLTQWLRPSVKYDNMPVPNKLEVIKIKK